ncbi:bifunctional adenosylcobinamide kinase/adenosylcobinamide-phosphate guanylyltransferase [Lysinibacillus fusiformis]
MPLIFITGGVRSGKSHFAEQAAIQYFQAQPSTEKRLKYIASGIALDDEMEKRIDRHQADRLAQPIKWLTVEALIISHPYLSHSRMGMWCYGIASLLG